jgi:hypothetical protein
MDLWLLHDNTWYYMFFALIYIYIHSISDRKSSLITIIIILIRNNIPAVVA